MKQRTQKYLALFLTLILFVSAVPVTAEESKNIKVFINGEVQTYDQPPILEGGRTLVPLRGIFERLGSEVTWDATTRTIRATKNDTTIIIRIDDKKATVAGNTVILDIPPKIINGRTLVPLRFVSESLGAQVNYDPKTFVILITFEEFTFRKLEPRENSKNTVVYKENVKKVTDDVQYTVTEDGNKVEISSSLDIQNGDIILLPSTKDYPFGIAKIVESYQKQPDRTVVITSEPLIDDIVSSIDISRRISLDASQFIPAEGVTVSSYQKGLVTTAAGIKSGGWKLSVNNSLNSEIGLNGEIVFEQPTFFVDIQRDFLSIDRVELQFQAKQRLKEKLFGTLKGEVGSTLYLGYAIIPVYGPVGIKAVFSIKTTLSGEAEISVTYEQTLQTDLGFIANDSNIDPSGDINLKNINHPPQLKGTLKGEITFNPDFFLSLAQIGLGGIENGAGYQALLEHVIALDGKTCTSGNTDFIFYSKGTITGIGDFDIYKKTIPINKSDTCPGSSENASSGEKKGWVPPSSSENPSSGEKKAWVHEAGWAEIFFGSLISKVNNRVYIFNFDTIKAFDLAGRNLLTIERSDVQARHFRKRPVEDSVGNLYILVDYGIVSYDSTGQFRWAFNTDRTSVLPKTPIVTSKNGIITGNGGRVLSINNNGNLNWEYTHPTDLGYSVSDYAIDSKDQMYFTYRGKLYAIGADGKQIYGVGDEKLGLFGTPVIGQDDIVYVMGRDHIIYAYKDGKRLWVQPWGVKLSDRNYLLMNNRALFVISSDLEKRGMRLIAMNFKGDIIFDKILNINLSEWRTDEDSLFLSGYKDGKYAIQKIGLDGNIVKEYSYVPENHPDLYITNEGFVLTEHEKVYYYPSF